MLKVVLGLLFAACAWSQPGPPNLFVYTTTSPVGNSCRVGSSVSQIYVVTGVIYVCSGASLGATGTYVATTATATTATSLGNTGTGVLRTATTIAGPTSWTTLDSNVPWFGREYNANSFSKSIMASAGGAWPFAVDGEFLNLPSTAASMSSSPGYAIHEWGGISNTAFSNGVSGAALGGDRGELFCAVDNCGIFGTALQLVCANTDPSNGGYTVHPCNRAQPLELDIVNDSASSATMYGALIVGNSNSAGAGDYDAVRIQSNTGSQRGGTAVPFNNAYVSDIAAATHGVWLRALAAGNSQNSQDLILEATFSNGAALKARDFMSSVGTRTFDVPAGGTYSWLVNSTAVGSINASGVIAMAGYNTATNCSSTASPAVCGSAASGSSTIAASATSKAVNTTAVTANSQITITEDQGLGTRLGVTCNTQSSLVLGTPRVSARVPGTSFTVIVDVAPTTNPLCFNYTIEN